MSSVICTATGITTSTSVRIGFNFNTGSISNYANITEGTTTYTNTSKLPSYSKIFYNGKVYYALEAWNSSPAKFSAHSLEGLIMQGSTVTLSLYANYGSVTISNLTVTLTIRYC